MNLAPFEPWSSFQPTPQIITCENWLTGWVRQPSNTWTSLFYFVSALFLFIRQTPGRRAFILILILIGVSSILAHASMTLVFGAMDFGSIFLLGSYLLSTELKASGMSKRKVLGAGAAFWVLGFFLYLWKPWTYQITLGAGFLTYISLHMRNTGFGGRATRPWVFCGVSSLIAGIAFIKETGLRACDPSDHFFQLHGVWHLGTAAAIYFLAQALSVTARPT